MQNTAANKINRHGRVKLFEPTKALQKESLYPSLNITPTKTKFFQLTTLTENTNFGFNPVPLKAHTGFRVGKS